MLINRKDNSFLPERLATTENGDTQVNFEDGSGEESYVIALPASETPGNNIKFIFLYSCTKT